MPINRPYRRTCRQFTDGLYTEGGRWKYLLHKKYASDPQHYIRAFSLLQQDLKELFSFVEPADNNLKTYSHRIHQLLTRSCIEIEANLSAILIENDYSSNAPSKKKKPKDWNMNDYKLVNYSHRLSSFIARIPMWNGTKNVYSPFDPWGINGALPWYTAYNASKHDRQNNFGKATFKNLIKAMCGLAIVITAQFHNERYSPGPIGLAIGFEGYDSGDGMISAVGNLFRVKLPNDWPIGERYDFDWNELRKEEDPFQEFNHAAFTHLPKT